MARKETSRRGTEDDMVIRAIDDLKDDINDVADDIDDVKESIDTMRKETEEWRFGQQKRNSDLEFEIKRTQEDLNGVGRKVTNVHEELSGKIKHIEDNFVPKDQLVLKSEEKEKAYMAWKDIKGWVWKAVGILVTGLVLYLVKTWADEMLHAINKVGG